MDSSPGQLAEALQRLRSRYPQTSAPVIDEQAALVRQLVGPAFVSIPTFVALVETRLLDLL